MGWDQLRIDTCPKLRNGRLILSFSGWMDGGDVSIGTVRWIIDRTGSSAVAKIDPEPFYIFNFPGSMETSTLFRPHARIEAGIIRELDFPSNTFYCSPKDNLLLFAGKEPNLLWKSFADCIFSFAAQAGVSMIYFVGSYAGAVPHTREPRILGSVSNENLKADLERYVAGFSDYEGPASFMTYLMSTANNRGLCMASLVEEVPAYVQGTNPKGITTAIRKLAAILGLHVNLNELQTLADIWEKKLNDALQGKPELLEYIHKLEENYDNEVFNTQMGDLRDWLEQQGIQVD